MHCSILINYKAEDSILQAVASYISAMEELVTYVILAVLIVFAFIISRIKFVRSLMTKRYVYIIYFALAVYFVLQIFTSKSR